MNNRERIIDGARAVAVLADKAAKAEKSEDAMRFSQAALNTANATITLANVDRINL